MSSRKSIPCFSPPLFAGLVAALLVSRPAHAQRENTIFYDDFTSGNFDQWTHWSSIGPADFDVSDPVLNETILSGDLAGDDAVVDDTAQLLDEPTRAENSYHVVTATGVDSTTVLDGLTISGGQADGPMNLRGGALFNDVGTAPQGGGQAPPPGTPRIVACDFTHNAARADGGAAYTAGRASAGQRRGDEGEEQVEQLALERCRFTKNLAGENGGALYTSAGSPSLTHCTFSDNSTTGNGGAMLTDGGTPSFDHCVFRANSAVGFSSDPNGGAMWNRNSNGVLTNCTFIGNWIKGESTPVGGAVVNEGSSPTLVNCRFAGNSATGESTSLGGAMFNYNDSSPTLVNCTFRSNSTSGSGGAVFNWQGTNEPTFINCTFSGNTAGANGGGIFHNSGGIPTVTNCLFWGNRDQTGLTAAAQLSGGSPVVSYSCIQGGWWSGVGNINADPLFISPDDLRLRPGSPAIDAGDNSAVPADMVTDLASGPRYLDDPNSSDIGNGPAPIVDMGAFEFGDCNGNGASDAADVADGASPDCNGNGVPDECELDCNANGIPDSCDIAAGTSQDRDGDGVPGDINQDGTVDIRDATTFGDLFRSSGPFALLDLNGDGVVDIQDATTFGEIWRGEGAQSQPWAGHALPARPE